MYNAREMTLGLELGSTRIKAVLIGKDHKPLASGAYSWENRLENGVWVYHLKDVRDGVRSCFAELKRNAEALTGKPLTSVAAIGISGMMHGYLVLDRDGTQLAPFRTWRNTITAQAAEILSREFQFNIPQRWCAAHLYQAVLNGEEHVKSIAYMMTLSGYVHWLLTGQFVVGPDDASGMFPYDRETNAFDAARLARFDELLAPHDLPWKLQDILPEIKMAGEEAGRLTEAGANLLDPTGTLQPGIPFCPPEGDAGTGMISTGAVEPGSANTSAGTSAFSMLVLEQPLKGYYPEVDIVATPAGRTVAMIHASTCTSDIDAWVRLFADYDRLMGRDTDLSELYGRLFRAALESDADAGGMVAFNCYSGEHLCGTEVGRPMLIRTPESRFRVRELMRANLYSAVAVLRIGMDLLKEKENVRVDSMLGHGGFFKTPGVGARILAAALQVPVSTMETAGEGGPWGMALLAAYMVWREKGETLEAYLADRVFGTVQKSVTQPDAQEIAGFDAFLRRYRAGLDAQFAAAKID